MSLPGSMSSYTMVCKWRVYTEIRLKRCSGGV